MLIDEMTVFRLEIAGDSNIIFFKKKVVIYTNLMGY
jgi:hypothetical protein